MTLCEGISSTESPSQAGNVNQDDDDEDEDETDDSQ